MLANIRYRDRAIYLPESGALVLADVHLGRGRCETVAAPLDAVLDLEERLTRLCETFRPERVVFAGDLLDSFDHIPPGVEERAAALLEVVTTADAQAIVLAGNHDAQLSSVYDGDILDEYDLDGTVVSHGHERPHAVGERYIIGHEHPALRIDGVKRPCYLVGEDAYHGASIVVLPTFSPLLPGTAFNRQVAADCHSPILESVSLRECHPIIRDEAGDETLEFPPLERMAAFL